MKTEEQIKARRKAYYHKRRASLSPQQREAELVRQRAYNKRYRSELNPNARREDHLRYKYNITPEDWGFMFNAQGNCCAICKSLTPKRKAGWATDHCHSIGKVRGIICHDCNLLLGNAKDSIAILEAAITYLQKET